MAKKILIIDDDVELSEELSEAIRDEGHWVESAFDSDRGCDLIRQNDYDLYLLDFKMPGLNGFELLKKIKGKKPAARIFMVSGRPFVEQRIKEAGLEAMVEAVVIKPFDIEGLLNKIKTLD